MSIICIIPARAGSRRLPHKNRRLFCGQPIITYAIENARRTGLFDHILVSTDDPLIAHLALEAHCTVLDRPSIYAADEVGTQTVFARALTQYNDPNVRYVCGLYATTPLLEPREITGAFDILVNTGANYVVSVYDDRIEDAGGFYWGDANAFKLFEPLADIHTVLYPIAQHIDINTEDDWARAEQLYRQRKDTHATR